MRFSSRWLLHARQRQVVVLFDQQIFGLFIHYQENALDVKDNRIKFTPPAEPYLLQAEVYR
jgi:hypothetical protein